MEVIGVNGVMEVKGRPLLTSITRITSITPITKASITNAVPRHGPFVG
jgi:hypothetical protein